MPTRRQILQGGAGLAALAAGWSGARAAAAEDRVVRSDADWRRILTADQYAILRQDGTERPFTSPLLHEERAGVFACAGCGLALFSSSTKFDSGTGWPSFWAPLDGAVATHRDTSFGMVRNAVSCRRCEGHLGHVFDDGPKPTGLRYCMNGVALSFVPGTA
ncbi:peptide-methionine (R)-S-oxide reductase MsrB [Labrys wisconsinensis]|uniref:peptide-methionine (R)-S-oxide reductase n=1 Tax=Labrys wisconsinensis TaxID=425677 RepID=A0ABU0JDF3_9HYPH|nr:peptide-methionine (R)-S-oxide reductase MsrB [Labrys wisconsinensis]MDQ0471645.1 peptide-methionine (R)-S-oxide reductase [Labrys wisconsinensis]